jgi:dipeptidyl aminopeptidase/acylaminoacyl peptidase
MTFVRARLAPLLLAGAASLAHAQGEFVAPGENLVLDGLPPIPAEIAAKTAPYTDFKASGMLDWHPARRELFVRQRLRDTSQVHRVAEPGMAPEPLTDLADAIQGAEFPPGNADYFLFTQGRGGNEVHRIYRFDLATKAVTPLSPENERAGAPHFDRKGERIVFTTVSIDRHNPDRVARTRLYIAEPLKPDSARLVATFEGGGWTGFRFSPDGKRLAFLEYLSINEGHVWVMEIASGTRRRVSAAHPTDGPVAYASLRFAPDGRGLFAASDRGSEFRRLVHIELATGRERVLAGNLRHDVDDIEISERARRIAFVTNEAGAHVLRFLDLATRKELPRPALVSGVISGLRWRPDGGEIAFAHASARSPGDVFSYDMHAHRVTRWTNGNSPSLNASEFAEPRMIRWKSFDGREITGLYYHPPAKFEGVRPVLISVHGGPESQARAGFIGRSNYLVNELGIALIYPNVRGSAGFGKTFLKLDNGRLREDSVKDLGALLDWIGVQPGLDAGRVLVAGGSYGGYMALAAATLFPERIAGAISSSGISNFVTFLERTESYRRDLRRAEYGDERDPAMRAFLEFISPLNRAERIAKPLFIVQGRNDPRVPSTEAEQIVAALKKRGTPVWFLLAKDEGHGFAKKANADFQFFATVEFIRRTLLP